MIIKPALLNKQKSKFWKNKSLRHNLFLMSTAYKQEMFIISSSGVVQEMSHLYWVLLIQRIQIAQWKSKGQPGFQNHLHIKRKIKIAGWRRHCQQCPLSNMLHNPSYTFQAFTNFIQRWEKHSARCSLKYMNILSKSRLLLLFNLDLYVYNLC